MYRKNAKSVQGAADGTGAGLGEASVASAAGSGAAAASAGLSWGVAVVALDASDVALRMDCVAPTGAANAFQPSRLASAAATSPSVAAARPLPSVVWPVLTIIRYGTRAAT